MASSDKFNKAAQQVVSDELAALEKRILSDLAGMISDAHSALMESRVYQRFYAHLNGRKPGLSDLSYFKKLIELESDKHNPLLKNYFDVIVERDPRDKSRIGFEFRVKPSLFR